MQTLINEIIIIYIGLIIIIGLISILIAKCIIKNNNWPYKFKISYTIISLILFSILGLYFYFGSSKELIAQNFFHKNQQQFQQAVDTWQNQPNKIIAILEKKLKEKPDDLVAKKLLLNLYLRTKNYQAANILTQPLTIKQLPIDMQLLIAELKYRSNQIKPAILLLTNIINNNNADAEILWFAGKLARLIGNKPLTIQAWRSARAKLVLMQVNTSVIDRELDVILKP
jgi:hypothetical protein